MPESERVPRGGDRRRQLLAIDDRAQFEERRREVRRQEERERWDAFGIWVGDRRRVTGRSQAQCAKIAGIGQAQWNRIENSVHGTPIEKIPGIAEALKATVTETLRAAGYEDSDDPPNGTESLGDAMDAPATKADLERVRAELREMREALCTLASRLP